ncbi:zinc metallochaperone AztD [Solicola gregarius]|uniref:Secreted protein n=1 Tax=Solicola gregarius TaxID=2908642 RepID=A0AA46YN44_9ACTN|nr:zinc metallochaperone AztD [Solicola gregarius]UYM07229.1 hypothetical protein L0C25_09190 [Solicola gregarius]
MTNDLRTRRARAAAFLTPVLFLAACGSDPDESKSAATKDPTATEQEMSTATPRLVSTYDGGLHVLDANTLELLETVELDGFTRVNPAGDDRHVIVSTDAAFRVLDTGAWSEAHGDHEHHFTAQPELTDVTFETDHPGHVVHHADHTALFSDGTGRIEIFETSDLANGKPASTVLSAEQPHHGVAVPLPNGGLATSVGNEETRPGVTVRDAAGREVVRNEKCPDVHGEAGAAGGRVVFGCEDGVLVYDSGRFTKIASPDAYGRIGTQVGAEESPIVLGDYKVDPKAELERPDRVSLIDTARETIRLVDLGTSYSFRSLGRGPRGEAIVLGTDGALHVIDPVSGKRTDSIPVVGSWREPVDWQLTRPTLFLHANTAYVTEPATDELHRVDLAKGEVTASITLPRTPNELTGVGG